MRPSVIQKNNKFKINDFMLKAIKVLFIIHEIIVSGPNRAGAELKNNFGFKFHWLAKTSQRVFM